MIGFWGSGDRLKGVDLVFDELRPLDGLTALVEGLPGDGLADGDAEGLVHVFVHLIDQEKHGQIERQALVGEVGQTVEEIGVPWAKPS